LIRWGNPKSSEKEALEDAKRIIPESEWSGIRILEDDLGSFFWKYTPTDKARSEPFS